MEKRSSGNKIRIILLVILCATVVSVLIIRWREMPRYKGDLTLEQATANFNDYNQYYKKYPNIELLSDGTFQKKSGYKKKAGTEDDYVFQDGSSWPEIHWITEENMVTGAEVHIQNEAEPGAECPAYSDVLYLVTKALAEKDAGWIREKEYQALLKEFKTKNSGYEYRSFKHEWSSGEAECIRKVENGSYNTWHDAVIGSAETGKMSLDVTYSIHLK